MAIGWKGFGMAAVAAALLAVGCGGSEGVGSSATTGFVTYLEKVTAPGGDSFVLRRVQEGSGTTIDLITYPDLGFAGLYEGPSNSLFSIQGGGADDQIVRLDPGGATSLATVTGRITQMTTGNGTISYILDSTLDAGDPFVIRSLPMAGGAAVDAFNINVGEPTFINGLTTNRFTGDLFTAVIFTAPSSAGKVQIYRVSALDVIDPLAATFTGVVRAVSHARVGGVDYVYYLEQESTDLRVGRVRISDGNKEVFTTLATTSYEGIISDFDTDQVAFAVRQGGVRKLFKITGTTISSLPVSAPDSVVGLVLR